MILPLASSGIAFFALLLGLGWLPAARLRLTGSEKLLAAAAFGGLALFLAGWLVYGLTLPLAWLWLLPPVAAAGGWAGGHSLGDACRDRDFAAVAIGQVLCLAAGLLTHYSAAPYLLLLAAGWFWLGRHRLRDPRWQRDTIAAAAAGAGLLAVWFSWTFAVYGPGETLLSNTSVTDRSSGIAAQLSGVVLNLRDTLVPHFLRSVDYSLFAQQSPSGWWRDWFFQLYQTNLFFAFGSIAWVVLLATWWQQRQTVPPSLSLFWSVFVVGLIVLGVAAHGGRDSWGLTHICLQPLILLGLGFLAAHWPPAGRRWRLFLLAGMTLDFCLGVALQLGTQAYVFQRWLQPEASLAEMARSYSVPAQQNLLAKQMNSWAFTGDLFAPYAAAVACFLAIVLGVAIHRAARATNEATRTSSQS